MFCGLFLCLAVLLQEASYVTPQPVLQTAPGGCIPNTTTDPTVIASYLRSGQWYCGSEIPSFVIAFSSDHTTTALFIALVVFTCVWFVISVLRDVASGMVLTIFSWASSLLYLACIGCILGLGIHLIFSYTVAHTQAAGALTLVLACFLLLWLVLKIALVARSRCFKTILPWYNSCVTIFAGSCVPANVHTSPQVLCVTKHPIGPDGKYCYEVLGQRVCTTSAHPPDFVTYITFATKVKLHLASSNIYSNKATVLMYSIFRVDAANVITKEDRHFLRQQKPLMSQTPNSGDFDEES